MNKQPVQTVQQTSKVWKVWTLVGLGLAIGGFALAVATGTLWVGTIALVGVVILLGARMMAWWHHG